ncbi:hypothetical protein BIWAKO_06130 [Bosea sp. BIWAKO-01]|nr:hypothetical protein BIWAKO_06130 [Bosea sp. BIWAKO-01]
MAAQVRPSRRGPVNLPKADLTDVGPCANERTFVTCLHPATETGSQTVPRDSFPA